MQGLVKHVIHNLLANNKLYTKFIMFFISLLVAPFDFACCIPCVFLYLVTHEDN